MRKERRAIDDWSDSLNPILLKELRQELRSSEFVRSFLILHSLSLIDILACLFFQADQMVISRFAWMAIIFFVFKGSVRRDSLITSERKENTLDLLLNTGLGPKRILIGKWWAGVAVSILYAVSVLPYFVFHYVIFGENMLFDFTGIFILIMGNSLIQGIGLVSSSLTGLWVRNGFLSLVVSSIAGAVTLSIVGMKSLGLFWDFEKYLYFVLCTAFWVPILTLIILNLHGSMRPPHPVKLKKNIVRATLEFFQVRSSLEFNDRFNPFLVKEIRLRIRSGQYPLLILVIQALLFYITFFQYPEMFWVVATVLLLVILPMREVGPLDQERKGHTLEPILFTKITGRDLVSAAWTSSVIEGVGLSVGLLPWIMLRALFLKQHILIDMGILIFLNILCGLLVASTSALVVQKRFKTVLVLVAVCLLPVTAVITQIGLFFDSLYFTPIFKATGAITALFLILLLSTKIILSIKWTIRIK